MTQSITAIIADDEPLLRFHLEKMFADVWHDLEILAVCANGKEALNAIETHQPDIAFLDIKMPELDGMSLANQLQKNPNSPFIVFITAYDEFAVKAFENNAIDYLLKPISESRLTKACEKIQQQLIKNGSNNSVSNQVALNDLMAQIIK